MSQHHFDATFKGKPVQIVAGYDRPLKEFFVHIALKESRETVFTSLYEPTTDWSSADAVEAALTRRKIQIPAGLIEQLRLDQASNTGNLVMRHHLAGDPPEVLYPTQASETHA